MPTASIGYLRNNANMSRGQLIAFKSYIDAVMRKTGLKTPTAVAKKAGLVASTVNRPYAKQDLKHTVSFKTVDAIAKFSRVRPPPELIPGADPYAHMVDGDAPDSHDVNGGVIKGSSKDRREMPMNLTGKTRIRELLVDYGAFEVLTEIGRCVEEDQQASSSITARTGVR